MAAINLSGGCSLRACRLRHAFKATRVTPAKAFKRKGHRATSSTDSIDEVELRSFLPDSHDTSEESMLGSRPKDTVLRERVQALRKQHQTQMTESDLASTSQQHDDRDLLARTQHQLQRLNPSRLSPRVRGLILLNILVLLCGANWVVLKETGDFFDPFTFAALRFTLAAAVFFPWVKNAAKDRKVLKGGLELGIYSALAYQTQSVGLITSDASRASFISTFTVLIVPILAGISGRGVKPLTWASCIVALIGVGLLEQGGAPPGIGDVWNLLSALFFGLQVFRTEHYSHAIKASKTTGPIGLMAIIVYTVAALSIACAVIAHPAETQTALMHPQQSLSLLASPDFPWTQLAFTGLLSTDFVIYIELIALHDVTSIDAAVVYTLEPVLGASLAYLLLGERWGPAGWVGAALIILSSLTTQIFGQPDTPPADPPKDA